MSRKVKTDTAPADGSLEGEQQRAWHANIIRQGSLPAPVDWHPAEG